MAQKTHEPPEHGTLYSDVAVRQTKVAGWYCPKCQHYNPGTPLHLVTTECIGCGAQFVKSGNAFHFQGWRDFNANR